MAENENGASDSDQVRRDMVQLLLEKVEADPYPSVTMMDLVEQMLGVDERAAYAAVLMDKIRGDRFPSLDMLVRVRNLT